MSAFTLQVSVRGASCGHVSVAVRPLLEFEGSVSIALFFVAPTTSPLTAAAVVVVLVLVSCSVSSFLVCKGMVCLDITKQWISSTALRALFPEEIDRDDSQLPVVRPFLGWCIR